MLSSTLSWRVPGHQTTKGVMEAHLNSGRIAHAYLLAGPAGIGKRALAEEFAGHIVGEGNRPDVAVHNLAELNSLEAVRHILQLSALTPLSGLSKVVILQHIHTISPAIANALLKTLEEPTAHTTFLLVSDATRVMPTIMSRCQILPCNRLGVEDLRQYAQAQGWTTTDEQLLLAAGNLQRLELIVSGRAATSGVSLDQLAQDLSAGDFERMQLVQNLSALTDDNLQTLLQNWLHLRIGILKVSPRSYPAVQVTLEVMQRLKKNLNKKMVLEYFVDSTAKAL